MSALKILKKYFNLWKASESVSLKSIQSRQRHKKSASYETIRGAGTGYRNRTGMAVRPADFKSAASTSSANPAGRESFIADFYMLEKMRLQI